MKILPQIYYEDVEFKEISSLKEEMGSGWHDFILDLVRYRRSCKEEDK